MKTGLTVLGMLLLAQSSLAETIQLSFEVPAPKVMKDAGGYSHVVLPGYQNLAEPGHPELPVRSVPVLLPAGHQLVGVTVVAPRPVELEGIHLVHPAQRVYPTSYRGPRPFTRPNGQVYSGRGQVPAAVEQALATQIKHGFTILPVQVRPVQFWPAEGKLSFLPAFTLVIQTQGPDKPQDSRLVRGLPSDFSSVSRLVANPGMLQSYPKAEKAKNDRRYLVVTSAELLACPGEQTLQTLLAEKEARGITTHIETMEAIRAAYPDGDDPNKVRSFIQDMYAQHGTEYVLLAGDADLEQVGGETQAVHVPVRGLWGDIDFGGVETNLISDLYYSNLDGDFDADRDGIYGEPNDEADLLSEVLVGRVPADSCAEMENFVRKSLAYRAELSARLKKTWLLGEWISPENYSKSLLEDLRQGSWQAGILAHGFVSNPFFEVSTLYDADLGGNQGWGPDELFEVLNSEPHIVNHSGHSSTHYNMRVTCDELDANLSNQAPFFQYTLGCYPGAFDNRLDLEYNEGQVSPQDSISEHLLLSPYGAFASVMHTRYGVGGYMLFLFWEAAFGQGLKSLSAMHAFSRDSLAGLIENKFVRWEVYGFTYFGDPEQSLHMHDSSRPVLGLSEPYLYLIGVQGGEAPQAQTLTVRNDGQGTLDWTVTSDQPWLQVWAAEGQAPGQVQVSADTSLVSEDYLEGSLTFSAPGADNSPQAITVVLYLVTVPTRACAHTTQPPVLDGRIVGDEYEQATDIDIGFVAPGLTWVRMMHDNQKLYLAMHIDEDRVESENDAIVLAFDSNNDDAWPTEPGHEGIYNIFADGLVSYTSVYNNGGGMQSTEYTADATGLESAWGSGLGRRELEIAIDLTESHLQSGPGGSFGLYLAYYNWTGGDYELLGGWPHTVPMMDDCRFLGDVEITPEADIVLVDPDSLALTAVSGGEPAGPVQLLVDSTSQDGAEFEIEASQPWIDLSLAAGATPQMVEVQAQPADLEPGSYTASIMVYAPTCKNSPLEIPVTFEVSEPPPVMTLSETRLSFSMQEGDSKPAAQSLTISNTGGGVLEWTATPAGSWFELSSQSGTAPSTIEVSVVDATLGSGTHTGMVSFQSALAEPVVVELSLTVIPLEEEEEPDNGGGGGCATSRSGGSMALLILMVLAGLRRTRRRSP